MPILGARQGFLIVILSSIGERELPEGRAASPFLPNFMAVIIAAMMAQFDLDAGYYPVPG